MATHAGTGAPHPAPGPPDPRLWACVHGRGLSRSLVCWRVPAWPRSLHPPGGRRAARKPLEEEDLVTSNRSSCPSTPPGSLLSSFFSSECPVHHVSDTVSFHCLRVGCKAPVLRGSHEPFSAPRGFPPCLGLFSLTGRTRIPSLGKTRASRPLREPPGRQRGLFPGGPSPGACPGPLGPKAPWAPLRPASGRAPTPLLSRGSPAPPLDTEGPGPGRFRVSYV